MLVLPSVAHCLLLTAILAQVPGLFRSESALDKWAYPGSAKIASTGGKSGFDNIKMIEASAHHITTDDVDKVFAFYIKRIEELSGTKRSDWGNPEIPLNGAYSIGDKTLFVSDDSVNRPVRLIVMNIHLDGKSACVVISRGKDEKATNVHLSYYEKTISKPAE